MSASIQTGAPARWNAVGPIQEHPWKAGAACVALLHIAVLGRKSEYMLLQVFRHLGAHSLYVIP